MAHDGQNCYFLFWAILCPFTLLTVKKKIKIKKNKEKNDRYHHFTSVHQNYDQMICGS